MEQATNSGATPTGTFTFLFTDIEGSTRLWAEQGDAMRTALARHDRLLRDAIVSRGGQVFKTIGDAFCAVFDSPAAATEAAVAAQHALLAEDWGPLGALRVRMALHTGEAQERDGDYFGTALNRVARLLSAAHGGQVLVSAATHEIIVDHPPLGVSLRDLGEHRLKDLARPTPIYQLVVTGLPETFPALRTLGDRPNNLPIQLTSFVGRDAELAALGPLAKSKRLLTLVGVGGTGKTRLALQLAADLLADFPDGVWLVELAALDEPSLVAQTVATVLGLQEQSERPIEATLVEYLKGREMVIVLDNCEHLVAACAELATQVLATAPNVRLLATSREALRVRGEFAWPVPALGLPAASAGNRPEAVLDAESAKLFVDRAFTHRPSFELTTHNAPAVAGICRRLDGIPLAIELAAARIRSLTPEQILSRLDNRFALLTGQERRAGLAHHQTLQAAIDWSHELLNEEEQVMFRRLAVFRGGWTLEAAEAVAADDRESSWMVMDGLGSLVDKSLVVLTDDGETARYRMLESIGAYALQKLAGADDAETVAERHAAWFLGLAETAALQLQGAEQAQWLRRLTAEHDNLRAARSHFRQVASSAENAESTASAADAKSGESAEQQLRLAAALSQWWLVLGRLSEGREWLAEALDAGNPQGAAAPAALEGAGDLAYRQGDYRAAVGFHERALVIHREQGDERGVARSLRTLGNIADEQGDFERAIALHHEALDTWRQLGDDWGMAAALNNLAVSERHAHNLEDARTHLLESLARFEAQANDWAMGVTHSNLGDVATDLDDPDGAEVHYAASLELARGLEDKEGTSYALGGLADAARMRKDFHTAWTWLAESRVELQDLGAPSAIWQWLESAALLAVEEGRMSDAARLMGAAEAVRADVGAPVPPNRAALVAEAHDRSRRDLGAAAFALAFEQGQTKPWQVIADAVLHGGSM